MERLSGAARTLAALGGWRAVLLQLGCGALTVLALAPVHFLPALTGHAALFLRLAHCQRKRDAFWAGWAFAFGYHVAGLYWISNALLVDSDKTAWMIPFAAAGLPAVLGLFAGTAAVIGWRFSGVSSVGRLCFMVAVWSLFEWLRGVLFTGFPWNLAAYAWAEQLEMMQSVAWIGSYGLTLVTVLLGAAPALLVGRGGEGAESVRPRRFALVSILALVALLWGGGVLRLSGAPVAPVDGVVLRLVQGNVPQRDKWRPELGAGHVRAYVTMSTAPAPTVRSNGLPVGARPTHVIWPETAVPYFINEQPRLVRALEAAAPVGGALIVGAPRIERGGDVQLFNSLYGIEAGSGIVTVYDKSHLVPFGEYVPLRDFLPLPTVVQSFRGFTPGSGARAVTVTGLPSASSLICYEVIFPGEVVSGAGRPDARPGILLNLTNDAWYGRSSGPYQHFAIARYRAVEEGIPLLRSANTGISGVVDANGRVIAKLDLDQEGAIDSILPGALKDPTLFAQFGNSLFFSVVFILVFLGRISK